MNFSDLNGPINELRPLDQRQQENLKSLIRISARFHAEAGLELPPPVTIDEHTVVLESGHQPNFLPHPGLFRKIFLLEHVREILSRGGAKAIAFFGFADQNLSTKPLLYENRIPASNREGFRKIGFKLRGKERWKRFNAIPKPSEEDWIEKIEEVRTYYRDLGQAGEGPAEAMNSRLEWILGFLDRCYRAASSLSELNARFIALASRELFESSVFFFRYSDLQRAGLFLTECRGMIASFEEYNRLYNERLKTGGLDIPEVEPGELPLWYHCECGGKVRLNMHDAQTAAGSCPVCNAVHELDLGIGFRRLEDYYSGMDFTAVFRNLIFAEGMGTGVFISGTGGSLKYGAISNAISGHLGYRRPITMAWRARDYYMGNAHRLALLDLMEACGLSMDDLRSGHLRETVLRYMKRLQEELSLARGRGEEKGLIRRYEGRHVNCRTRVNIASRVFETVPSILDILVHCGTAGITGAWSEALGRSAMDRRDGMIELRGDICYGCNDADRWWQLADIPVLYRQMQELRCLNEQ